MYTTNRLSLLSSIPGKLRQRWVRLALILSVGLVGLTASVSLYASMSEARQSNSGTAGEAVETLTARMVAAPATITVNNAGEAVGNNGNCTLREAIIAANTNTASGAMAGECVAGMAGADTIVFSLGASTPAINLTSQLPIITEPVTIKGNSGGATRVELNGAGAGAGANGLRISAGNSTILRLAINRFTGDGILISGTGLNTIKGCLIGTNASGTAAQANANGIRILGSSNHTIGGTATGDRNLISGNTGAGILIAYDTPNTLAASGNKVIGNFIGTDANGKIDLGNGGFGVDIVGGSNSAIGGVTPEERNIISGNNGGGVGISSTTATGNVIIGNFIGTDITSLAPLGNGGAGVSINGAPNNRVGGVGVPCPADNTKTCSEGNTIRFNGSKGVVVKMNSATNNRILGNSISDNTGLGIDLGDNGLTNHTVPDAPTGVSATAGNAQATVSFTPPDSDGGSVIYAYTVTSNPGGITASGSSSPITVTGLMNGTPYTFTVKATNFVGASLASGASNSVTPMAPPPFAPSNPSNTLNSVAPNAVLMLPDSTGPNGLQNFPVLTGVTVGASSSTINGTLRSSANTTFRIEFFLNPLCDSSGNGEGQTFLGSTDVTTSIFIFNDINSGTVSFSKTLDFPLPGGLFVTATATRISGGIPVETSEFSACRSIPFTTGGCHYIVNPGVMNFSAAGGSTAFNVTAEGGCGWSATSNVGWVHVTSGASGSGNGTVGISVDANTGTFRFGTVTIAGTDYTFSQDAPCSATVSPSAMAFTAPAGSSTFNLYIPANCPWTISDPTAIFPWITVTTQLSGSGPTIVDFTIEANPGPSERVGVIMVAGQTYILTQDAPCTASINPSSKSFTSVGGNGTFNLTIGATCSWTATTADSWITITSATTGMGNAAFSYTVAANTGGQRTGIISVAGKALVISQEPACPPMISPSSQSFMPAGGNGNINVTIGAGCTWQATTNNTWITINSGANGTGNGTVNFTVAANSGAERSGVITAAGQSFLVQQSSPCTYTVSPSLQGIVAAGGTGSTNVTVGPTCSWMAASSVPWITVTSGATGTGNGTVNYSVATNGTGSQRSGQITIADKSLLITQDAGCTFTVMPTSQNFVAAGGMNTVSVTTAGGCAWLASSNAPWITITSSLQSPKEGQLLGKSPISQFPGFKNSTAGVGNGTVAYTVAANTGPPRTGTMFVAGELVTINQATGCPITISPANLNAGQLGVNYNQALSQSGGMGTINWTVNVGSLPAGLMLDQSTGVLSGMPSVPGTFGFTIRATAANGCYGEQPYMLVINCQSLSISPATLNAGTYGNLYSQQLTLMGGSGVTNWTVSAGSLPSGLGLNQTSGLLSGTPGMVGMFSFTVKGTVNSTGCFATQAYTLTIGCQTISIDQPTINSGTINVPYSQQLSQTGGAGNITWTLSSGPLPNNLTLSPGGLISGTPTVSGGFPITVRATDTNGCFNEKIYTLTVNCQTINITPATLNTGVINTGYSQQLSQTGGAGNITWTLSPGSQPLPNNLTLSSGGLISGTPIVSGGFSITVRATDANGCFNDKAYTLMIDCQTITITTASLNPGAIGSNYNQQLSQSGGVGITWTLSSGSLPSNLTLSASGLISGIPSVSGSFPITVKAAQSNGCFGEKQFLLLVNCQPINITPATLNPGVLGTNYNQPLTQTGGSGSIAWTISAGAMPSGITLNSTSGLLSGMPASAGTFNFTVRAAETNNCFGERAYTLVINCQSLSITPATLNSAMIVTNYSQQLSLTGGSGSIDWTIVAGALPSGITLHPTSGLLSGLPNVSGTFNFTVKAAISTTGCFAQQAYTLVITCPAITVDPPTISSGSLGVPYSQQFTQTGAAFNVTWSLSSGLLPNNLILSASGLLSGTPVASGSYPITVRATDGNLCFGEKAYTLQIGACPTISITPNGPNALPNGLINTNYNKTLTASGGTPGYNFTVGAGLPGGMSLSAAGVLSGAPNVVGSFNFTVTATDQAGCAGTQAYTLIVSGNGLMFYPLTNPVRLLDTRGLDASPNACTVNGNQPITGGTSLLQMARGICGIPANAQAITGNVTTVNSGGGYLTLYPSGATRPTVASINYNPNEIVNNVFTVGLGAADGKFNIYALDTTDTIIDVTGYYAPPAAGGLYFHPLPAPVRLLETRSGLTPPVVGCVQPGAPLAGNADSLQTATTACTGIPAAARAIVGNATTVSPQGGGYLTLFPADAARPLIASSNYDTGQIINGPFTTGLSAAGQFKVFTYATTDLVIDVLGYYSDEAVDANGAGLLFTPLASPVRLLETRNVLGFPGCFKPNAPLNGNQTYTQPARGTCDGLTIPASALGVVGNATTVSPQGGGYLTLWPSSAAQPTVATLNYNSGQIVNRHFIVGLGNADGAFKMFSFATTDLVIDLTGYFAP